MRDTGPRPRRRGHGHRGVQAPYEAPGGGYVRVGGGARTGDDRGEHGAQFGDPHPPQERRADDQHRARRPAAPGARGRPCARYLVAALGPAGGPWAGWVRSSSQLSQSGVSAIAEGAGTSSRSARSRTSR